MPVTRAISTSSSKAFTFAYMYWAPGNALTLVCRQVRSSKSPVLDGDESQTPRNRSISSTSRRPLVIERRCRMVSAPPGETVAGSSGR